VEVLSQNNMKNKRHFIKDIASTLNVSITTVSFVLNGKAKEKRISDKVAKKILDYVKEINYKPNLLAQSLRTGKSKVIVFMVEDISDHIYSKVARIIEDLAYVKGYRVLFCSNENDDERSLELISLFRSRQVDGFILVPSVGIKNKVASLVSENVAVVLFDRFFPGLETNYVIIDNEDITYSAIKHLISNDFKNIAFITIDVNQTQMMDRLKGYKTAIKEHGLSENILKISYHEKVSVKGKEIIKEFLTSNTQLDAVFFATNFLAKSGLEVIKENFPLLINKIGIISFDDNDYYKIYTPTISSISQPLNDMAQEVMNTMLALLKNKGKNNPAKKTVLKAKLHIRESSMVK